jgi:hypothetical protein
MTPEQAPETAKPALRVDPEYVQWERLHGDPVRADLRAALGSEQELHAAWRKRAEEAESRCSQLEGALREQAPSEDLDSGDVAALRADLADLEQIQAHEHAALEKIARMVCSREMTGEPNPRAADCQCFSCTARKALAGEPFLDRGAALAQGGEKPDAYPDIDSSCGGLEG